MRWVIRLIIFTSAFWGVARFCKKETGSFTVARITSTLAYHPEWDVPSSLSKKELRSILSQPYSFLGKGAQSFVFVSDDGQYVIKFFRHHHLSAPLWVRWMPFKWAQNSVRKKESKLFKDFTSYKIAYHELKEETGLIYLHLNKTSDLNLKLILQNKIGIRHVLDLDQYEFIVQKRATLCYKALENWIETGAIQEAKKGLSSLVKLLALRSQKGISDKDPDLNTNFGFIGTQAIQIDVGRFKYSSTPFDRKELMRITDNLHQWLEKKSPELDAHLEKEILSL